MRLRQEIEERDAGPAYCKSGFVCSDELGHPLSPAWYSQEFTRLVESTGLPLIRVHDVRHSANSMLAAKA